MSQKYRTALSTVENSVYTQNSVVGEMAIFRQLSRSGTVHLLKVISYLVVNRILVQTGVYTNYVSWPRAAISSFSSIGWIFSPGSDAIPFPQPKPRTVRIHIIMPSVCSREVAQLEGSGVRKGENVLQPFNLCDRLLGIHSASIFTRNGSPKESGQTAVP
jgi:hypothetical protein